MHACRDRCRCNHLQWVVSAPNRPLIVGCAMLKSCGTPKSICSRQDVNHLLVRYTRQTGLSEITYSIGHAFQQIQRHQLQDIRSPLIIPIVDLHRDMSRARPHICWHEYLDRFGRVVWALYQVLICIAEKCKVSKLWEQY